jgi:hypothetical protein
MTLKPNSWYAVVAKSADEAEVMIYDEIGMFGVTAKQFVPTSRASPPSASPSR